ncbi:MAG: hypothetical protein FWF78_10740 [Defluviitaleaceae bacterium]|nr:hypothetical protein [Defluviitaleaceae bacterium]
MEENKYIKILHNLFETNFMEAYRSANNKKRRRVLPYLQAIHRRWYYATLVEHTPLSPANLVECIGAYFGEATDKYPVAVLRTPSKVQSVDYRMTEYTVENHPAVTDMRKLMEYCMPHIDLHENNCLTDVQALEIAGFLSINDPHYASFLLELAVWMKLLSKVPSLYVQRMQLSKKSADILEQPNEDLLRDIINAAVQMSAWGLGNSVPMPEHIFSESFVRSLLAQPLETDEIFSRVFEVMGYDIEDLLEISNMPVPEGMSPDHFGIDIELLSGTFVMGIVLDRFFFTPFGHFLRLIRPLYALPFSFSEEVKDYINVSEDPEEAFVAFFAPCSSYTLTDLGLQVLGITKTNENYFDASELEFEQMKETVFSSDESLKTFVEMATYLSPLALGGSLPRMIYSFRVRMEADNSVWLHLHVPDNFTLAELYDEITHYFELKNNDDYSFFHDKVENRFAEYPSAKRAAKSKNPKPPADDSHLHELDFGHMNHLILAAYGQNSLFAKEPPTVRLQLERLNEKPPEPGEIYPQAGRMSKNMRAKLLKNIY